MVETTKGFPYVHLERNKSNYSTHGPEKLRDRAKSTGGEEKIAIAKHCSN